MIPKALFTLAVASTAYGRIINGPNTISSAFSRVGPAPDAQPVTFTVYLTEANLAGLTTQMDHIASSGSAWLTPDQLAAYVTPTAATTSAVNQFLASANIPASAISYNSYGDVATVTTTAAALKALFPGTQFSVYNYLNNQIVRTTSLVVPDAVSSSISHIGGLAEFPVVRAFAPSMRKPVTKRQTTTPDNSKCNDEHVTPDCLRHYYGDYSYVVNKSVSGSKPDITIMGYIGQYVRQADLTQFLNTYRPDAASYQIPISTYAGAINNQSQPGLEAMLDVETIVSHTYPLKSNFISYGTVDDPNDIFAETFDLLRSNSKITPGIVSISYGADESGLTYDMAVAMCNSAQKLSALGTTIVISSGDSGVDGSGPVNGDVCLGTTAKPFIPTYPGGCQYVSSIGATMNFDPEVMVSDTAPLVDGFFSGAGRSNYFPIPKYQSSYVAQSDAQLSTVNTPPGSFNTSGRSFPDYVANGLNYAVIVNGSEELVGGTSASAPTTASVFALLNNALKSKKKATLGWSQPKLYPLIDTAFNDIKSGGSYGCGADSSVTKLGFPSYVGFDGASGLGSPQFANLRSGLGA